MNMHGLVRSLSLAARGLRAKWPLREAQAVGGGARVTGQPYVENHGRIEIGRDFTLANEPIPSHLVVGQGASLKIGDRVSIGHGAGLAATSSIVLEDDVVLAPMVMIMDTDFHDADSMASDGKASPVIIEAGARIGANSVLLKGTHVGKNAVIAPGSVVSGTVVAGTAVGGVPARVLREKKHPGRGAPMDKAEVADKVKALIAETFHVPRAVTLEDGPATLGGWDSLGVLRLLVTLEDELGTTIEAGKLAGAKNVAEVIAVVG